LQIFRTCTSSYSKINILFFVLRSHVKACKILRWWIVNRKWFGRDKRWWPSLCYHSTICLEGLSKTVKTLVELVSHPKGKFPNEYQKHYCPIPQNITILLVKKGFRIQWRNIFLRIFIHKIKNKVSFGQESQENMWSIRIIN